MTRKRWALLLIACPFAFGATGPLVARIAGLGGLALWCVLGAVVGGCLGFQMSRAQR